uniref:Uncharacterized protein n=1 Tax=Anguilla anguilla TaxID=7936 RepID=A0A0E9XEL4_ANGAN
MLQWVPFVQIQGHIPRSWSATQLCCHPLQNLVRRIRRGRFHSGCG